MVTKYILLPFLLFFINAGFLQAQQAKMFIYCKDGVKEQYVKQLDSIKIMQPYHPCLFLKRGEEDIILNAIASSPLLESVHNTIISDCTPILRSSVSKYVVTGGRLLDVSEEVFRRIFLLAYAYRITGNTSYAARAEKEMLAAAAFQDWHPSHWLDTATLLAGMGIGYDWLYDYMSETSRELIRKAIINKGLNAGSGNQNDNNWNSVCNGGITVAALAIRDSEPAYADSLVKRSVKYVPNVLKMYAPDGGYPEGYGYWSYGTTYQCLMDAALDCAYGTDFGLDSYPGFMESAYFRQFTTAPSGKCFNFSDCASTGYIAPCLFWMAYKKNDPSILSVEARYLESTIPWNAGEIFKPLIMIYGSRMDLSSVPENKNHFWHNSGTTPVYVYRSGWTKTTDTYLGIKGGYAKSNHSHMDGGSFCYEYGGVRWSKDLGLQSYSTLEPYLPLWDMNDGSERWNVFRLGNSAHSTLTINNKHHKVMGLVSFLKTYMTEEKQGALLDMSKLYPEDVDLILRNFELKDSTLTITDSIKTKSNVSCDIQWIMNTDATSSVENDSTLLLTCSRRKMRLVASSPMPITMLQLTNVGPNDYDASNSGSRVGFETTFQGGFTGTLKIKLEPAE
jgi:hypothetical protein